MNKLCSDDAFLKVRNHRQSAVETVMNLADDENNVLLSSHTTYQLTGMVVWCCVNTLLNNYVSSMNDKLGGNSQRVRKGNLQHWNDWTMNKHSNQSYIAVALFQTSSGFFIISAIIIGMNRTNCC